MDVLGIQGKFEIIHWHVGDDVRIHLYDQAGNSIYTVTNTKGALAIRQAIKMAVARGQETKHTIDSSEFVFSASASSVVISASDARIVGSKVVATFHEDQISRLTRSLLPIPDRIDASRHFYNAFGRAEPEISARWIVKFCQKRDMGWEPITYKEIDGFYRDNGVDDGFWFNDLDTKGFTPLIKDDYIITENFVMRCYEASPK